MKIKTHIVQTETPPLQKKILDLMILNSDKKKESDGKESREGIKSTRKKRVDKKSGIFSW